MGNYSFPEEGLEAIKEHALSNYLPFNGGLRQHYQLRNFGKRKKPKKGAKFYAVEYEPSIYDGYAVWRSPIHLKNEKEFDEFNKIDDYVYDEEDYDEKGFPKTELHLADSESNRFYQWGTKKGFQFYGYKKLPKTNARNENEHWQNIDKLREKADSLYKDIHTYKYPKQSFFKIGMTNTTAEKRGKINFPKEVIKTSPNPYKTIYLEKDLTYLFEKIHPADVEVFIYFHLFYKYWKDKLFYFSPNKINLTPNPEHSKLYFQGYTEAFLFKNVEDKLDIINTAFNLIEELTKRQINLILKKMINFNSWWNNICIFKNKFLFNFDFDGGFSDDLSIYGDRYLSKSGLLAEIGFYEKWIPKDNNHIKQLFDKKAEEFILPNSKHYPEISDLETY